MNELGPDVVLLDVRMPELDGISCLRRLRKQDPDLAVIILSSYGDEEQINAARDAGARGYVVKTVEPVDLSTVIRSALESSTFTVWGVAPPEHKAPVGETLLSERESAVLEAVDARALQPRDRPPAVDQRADRQVPPAQRLQEARSDEPDRGGALRLPDGARGHGHERVRLR